MFSSCQWQGPWELLVSAPKVQECFRQPTSSRWRPRDTLRGRSDVRRAVGNQRARKPRGDRTRWVCEDYSASSAAARFRICSCKDAVIAGFVGAATEETIVHRPALRSCQAISARASNGRNHAEIVGKPLCTNTPRTMCTVGVIRRTGPQ